MIMSAFYQALSDLLAWFNSVRPQWQPTLDPSVANFFTTVSAWDWLFPVHELVISVAAVGTLVTALLSMKWLVKLVDWIADVIP